MENIYLQGLFIESVLPINAILSKSYYLLNNSPQNKYKWLKNLKLKREVIIEFSGKSIFTGSKLKNAIVNKNIKLNKNTFVPILNSRAFKSIANQNCYRGTHIVNFSSSSTTYKNDKWF
jgi:hypothetical protein